MEKALIDLLSLQGKVAIVTGGAQGVGLGIVDTLSAAGAQVIVADVNRAEAEKAAASLRAQGRTATALEANVANEGSVQAMVRQVIEQWKRLDILVNNAGIYPLSTIRASSVETWDRTLGVNLRGAYLCTRHAAEAMITGGTGGRIINISTMNTTRTYIGMAHYDSSKGGLNSFTKAAALEYAPFGITVNAVAPGGVQTPGATPVLRHFGQQMGVESLEVVAAEFAKRIPLGRWTEPADVGRAVWFLSGRAADYITGQIIYVDGGITLGM